MLHRNPANGDFRLAGRAADVRGHLYSNCDVRLDLRGNLRQDLYAAAV
jgi:hypothetical protein